MKFFEIKERIWQEIDNEWRVKILGGGIVPLHQSIHNQQVDAKALEWGNDVVTNRIFELGTTLRVFLSDFRHDRVRNYVASLSDKAGISFVEKFLNRIYEINPKRIINTRIKWMGLPAEVFFFPFEVEVIGTSSEPAEVLIGLFCCLATTAMALRNVADEVDMPSTLEYGNKRTCGLGGWTAVIKTMRDWRKYSDMKILTRIHIHRNFLSRDGFLEKNFKSIYFGKIWKTNVPCRR